MFRQTGLNEVRRIRATRSVRNGKGRFCNRPGLRTRAASDIRASIVLPRIAIVEGLTDPVPLASAACIRRPLYAQGGAHRERV